MSGVPHVAVRELTKRFGATVAVDAVSLDLAPGRVHALVGENGAGKSTLGKVIAGVHTPDEGTVLVRGEPVSFRSPRQALAAGITIIAQELSLVPARSVLDNVFLGLEDTVGPFLSPRAQRARYDELTERTGIRLPAETPVAHLTVADQQQVEILRALARRAELIVMDEPTSRLSARETANLLEVARSLAAAGTTIVYISHFLDDVLAVADEVSILRDGRLVRTAPAAGETPASLIESMIGRSLGAAFPDRSLAPPDSPPVLEVEGLTRAGTYANASLTVRAGEIVALAGLVGSGRSELARGIFGADPPEAGEVRVDGRPVQARRTGTAIRAGIAMIPESRKDQGLFLGRAVRDNVSLPHLGDLIRAGFVDGGRERTEARAQIEAVDVRLASDDMPVGALSGGNQQKVLFARWLMRRPRVLIADEPTRGVDVGAKRAIYDLLTDLARDGMGVLMISSELEEVIGLAHRVLVMRGGRIVAELTGDDITEETIMAHAFGTAEVAA